MLGITYIDFMAVLVIWYGDLPHEEIWFVERDRLAVERGGAGGLPAGVAVPALALLLAQVRNASGPLRAVGVCVLAGLACYDAYLIAPPAGALALLQPPLLPSSALGFCCSACSLSGVRLAAFGSREPS